MLGEALAIGCAATWAVSVILFKRSEAAGPVTSSGLNLFKNVVAIALLYLTMALTGDTFDWQRSPWDWGLLALSGVVGIALADTLYFAALRRIGAGPLAVVEMIYSPLVVLLSVVILGEAFGALFAVGGVLVLGGVGVAVYQRAGASHHRLPPVGILIGLAAASSMATGIVMAKPALERSGLVEATLIRLLAGVAAQLLWVLPRPDRAQVLAIFRPQRNWRLLVPASVLGAYISMLLWLGGMKYTDASVASVLNQLTVVFTLVLARLFLGEVLTARRAVGALTAVAGAILIVAGRG